mgnify:CR=1 FL=1
MSQQGVLPDLFVVPVADLPAVPKSAPFRKGSHSSWTGARAQSLPIWTEKQSALLQMLANGQPLTRNQLALFLHWPLSSVCSVLASVQDKIEVADYELVEWGDGRVTRRELVRVKG